MDLRWLPVLVVGDITSQRVREDFLLPTFTARLGAARISFKGLSGAVWYELIRSVTRIMIRRPRAASG